MDYRKKLIVEPGARFSLKNFDPAWHDESESKEDAQPKIDAHLEQMARLQYLLYAERKHSLLIVLQGIDAAGKDGVCRHVIDGMNPQGCAVTGFKQPSEVEQEHDFLWRIHSHVPGLGQVAVFNRSHYEDVLIVRVHRLVPEEAWSKRYDVINEFERSLTLHGTTIVKFFLYISKEEQLVRFRKRLDDPARHWKISESDYTERERWDQYIEAYEDMLRKCSTRHAPWYVIPADHKWFRNLAVSQIICATMQDLGMQMPAPTVDIARIRREYHDAARS